MIDSNLIVVGCRATDYTQNDIDVIRKHLDEIAPTHVIPEPIPEAGGVAEIWIQLGGFVAASVIGGIIGNRSDAIFVHFINKLRDITKIRLTKRGNPTIQPDVCFIEFTLPSGCTLHLNTRYNSKDMLDELIIDIEITLHNLYKIKIPINEIKSIEYPVAIGDTRYIPNNEHILIVKHNGDQIIFDLDRVESKYFNYLHIDSNKPRPIYDSSITDRNNELLRKLLSDEL